MNAPADVPRLLTAEELAEALGMAHSWFMRHRQLLVQVYGFPAPLPGFNRYDPEAVKAWVARQRGPAGASASVAPPEDDVAEWKQRLDDRAAQLAGT